MVTNPTQIRSLIHLISPVGQSPRLPAAAARGIEGGREQVAERPATYTLRVQAHAVPDGARRRGEERTATEGRRRWTRSQGRAGTHAD